MRLPIAAATVIMIALTFSCTEDDPVSDVVRTWAEKAIVAATGGTLTLSDGITLFIPPNALPLDGTVSVGRTGDEPADVPNGHLEVINVPFTVTMPADTIHIALQLSFPMPSIPRPGDPVMLVLYDGVAYFPFGFTVSNGMAHTEIDRISWNPAEGKKATAGSLIVYLLVSKQTPPEEAMGLKEVDMQDGTMVYTEPDADASSKVLLMVHGWTGSPAKWEVFLPKIQDETDLGYTDFWTFGYNSSWGIEQNAEIMAGLIEANANVASIDIVAHSMGGLVSRSMIETFGGDQYISHLITLGTPHHGSPLAALRYALGALIAMEDMASEGYGDEVYLYDYYSQGFKDLYPESEFIRQMMTLTAPPIPYYVLASTNEPAAWKTVSGQVLEGPDDGIVETSSAKGVPNAIIPGPDVKIPVALAHLQMTRNDPLYEQVLEILKEL